MIKNTFLHIPGIGPKTEQRLWNSGIHSWDDFTADRMVHLPQSRIDAINTVLEESRHHIKSGNLSYFSDRLAANQHWRFFPEFRGSTAYLDIETTGLEPWGCEITTIALYNGKSIFYYVNGQNLGDFVTEINKYSVIVTYNGKSFDVPFIEDYFGITLDHAHIDLRYILASLGYRGGLKSCEIQLGMDRGNLAEVDGYFAVLLWYDYTKKRNQKTLETLLAYNIQDTVNLETLMVMAYNMKVNDTPFHQSQFPEPVLPQIPFNVDMETVNRIKREHWF
ncbi:MAG: ribonuclease H-like domain-containing protein [Desulfobacterales bacterium]|nr:ribonuclease H-like domain-containing protein [Desulfobacterales bacterium]